MKKSVVLAMAMALGVTASAYAANPFSDVPAGHWAYDSISKLAAAGVIEGYGDDTFRGDRLMTRYEMAQIVAKAMAKGANVDKLAAEFASELDALGVRVAALEKKSDNVKITGEVRYHYGYKKLKGHGFKRNVSENGLRSRLYFTGKINDNWNYVGRIQNQQMFHNWEDPDQNNKGDEETRFNIAKLEGRLGGVNVVAGRDDDVFADGYIYDGEHDAIKLSYGKKWYVSGAYGKLTDLNEDGNVSKKFWAAEVGSKIEDSFVNGKLGYLKADMFDNGKDWLRGKGSLGIWYLGADFKLAKELELKAMYLHSDRDKFDADKTSKKNGYVFGLAYKGAEASEPGSWGLAANYYHQGRGTYLAHTIDGWTDFETGFKGWSIGGEYTVAKNMVLSVTYYDTKALKGHQEEEADKAKVIWTEFNVSF